MCHVSTWRGIIPGFLSVPFPLYPQSSCEYVSCQSNFPFTDEQIVAMTKQFAKVNPDLLNERRKGTFNVEELTNFLDGGKRKTEERRALVEFFVKDPLFQDDVPLEYLSYVDRYEECIKKSCQLFNKINEWMDVKQTGGSIELYQKISPAHEPDFQQVIGAILGGMLGTAVLKDGMPFALHYIMFVPTLMGQGTVEQQAHWIGRAWNCEIMGTYAQTELGHGTFIRGLETTAHYDPETEEFVLNSPTLTSYKWWPGGLGHTANYAVVVAQLHTKGVCYGIHPFVVQLRDEETHMPLPGIKVGEIGCKLGMNGTNQGYLGFNHYRIPRENMLMKNSRVLKDGTYVKSPSDKLTYGTMIFVRVALVKGIAASYLAKAVTIATRYSAVRRQSELIPGEGEPLIMEYKTQQYKLFPNIASSWAMFLSSRWIWDMYNSVTSELEAGDLERLPELHAMTCCLKAVCTADAARGIEECRRSCGGHGYMTCSGLPTTYGLATAAETYEGENTVLLLQTARFLLKAWSQAKAGNGSCTTTEYLTKPQPHSPWSNTMTNVITAYNQVAYGLIKDTADKVNKMIATRVPAEHAWNQYSNLLVLCAEAHCRAFLVAKFFESVSNSRLSPPLKKVMLSLSHLYGVYYLLKNLGYFLMYSSVKIQDVSSIQDWQETLLTEIRPNAVSLVDSFDICDEILSSPLGAYDGDVYNRLFDEANKSPLNAKPVNASFHKYLKPFLKNKM